jgi:hypothetical protein
VGDLRHRSAAWLAGAGALFAFAIGGASAKPAYAQNPVWTISAASSPTNFAKGDETGDDKYVVTVVDTGGGSEAASPIEVKDSLPSGLTASAVSGEDLGNGHALTCSPTPQPACRYEGFEMAPGDALRMEVTVDVSSTIGATVANSVSVSGGGAAASAQSEDQTTINSSDAGFGVSSFTAAWSGTQAGATVNLTAGFTFDQVLSKGKTYPAADAREAALTLPPGFVANPQAVPRCAISEADSGGCPEDTAVGVAFISSDSGAGGAEVGYSSLVYDTAPVPGQFGALTLRLPDVSAWLGLTLQPDGRVNVAAENLPAIGLVSITLTLWGVPSAYDGAGPDHVLGSDEPAFGGPGSDPPARFLTSAGSCGSAPDTTMAAESWEEPGTRVEARSQAAPLTGCERLSFHPSLEVSSDVNYANTPSGYGIDVQLPQPQQPGGLAPAEMESAKIALPEGADISLSAADGLEGCGEAEVALGSSTQATCPDASTIGTAEIETPILATPLIGHIYLAMPGDNPFRAQVGLYVVVEEQWSGVSMKLAGQLENNPISGRWEVAFEDLPRLPIEDLALRFSGGPRSLLSTPPRCGTATSTAELEPWSEELTVSPSSSLQIQSGAQGTPCQAPHPFSPTFVTNATTGSEPDTVSSLAMLVSRPEHDEEQELGTIAIEASPALAQMFAGAQTCGEPQGSEGLCGAASEVGQVGATVGLGSHPVELGGPIYLTGPYGGAAQSLAIVLPVDPAPFDFGTEVVQMAIGVNPSTGELTLTSGQLPTIVDGVPLHLDELLLRLDRGTFKTNPACEQLAVTGTITGTEGGAVRIASSPLGVSSPPCPIPSGPAPEPAHPTQATATVSLLSVHLTTTAQGVATVKLSCRGTASCSGRLTLTAKPKRRKGKRQAERELLGTANFSIGAGETITVALELSARGRSMLRIDHGRLRALLTISKSLPEPAQTQSESVRLSTISKPGKPSKEAKHKPRHAPRTQDFPRPPTQDFVTTL